MIAVLDANYCCHMFFHASPLKGHPDCVGDVLDWFLIRLNNLRGKMQQIAAEHDHGNLRCIAVFDGPGKCFRKSIEDTYKADREHDPQVFEVVDAAKDCCEMSDEWEMRIAPEAFEADDLMASIAAKATEPVVIITPDKDLNQCLKQGKVGIIKKASVEAEANHEGIVIDKDFVCRFYRESDLIEEFGFPANRWVEYQMIVGDSADNVKGCEGFGPVAAQAILQQFPETRLSEIDPDEIQIPFRGQPRPLSEKKIEAWENWLERYDDLKDIFTLRKELTF